MPFRQTVESSEAAFIRIEYDLEPGTNRLSDLIALEALYMRG